MMKITVLILLILSPTVWSQSAGRTSVDGLVKIAYVLEPGLSGDADVIRALDAVMGGERRTCAALGPHIDENCKIIPTAVANNLVAEQGITRIFGTENSRACGTLTLRQGSSIEDILALNVENSYSRNDNQITIQDPERGDIRLSANQFGIGARINTDDIAEGSSFRIGAGKHGGVGGTIKIPIGRRGK